MIFIGFIIIYIIGMIIFGAAYTAYGIINNYDKADSLEIFAISLTWPIFLFMELFLKLCKVFGSLTYLLGKLISKLIKKENG